MDGPRLFFFFLIKPDSNGKILVVFFLGNFLILINGAYRPKLLCVIFLSQHKIMLVSF